MIAVLLLALASAPFVEKDVAVPMRDGVVLRADVYRPAEAGRFPVLVHRTPYDRRRSPQDDPVILKALVQRLGAFPPGTSGVVVVPRAAGHARRDGEPGGRRYRHRDPARPPLRAAAAPPAPARC